MDQLIQMLAQAEWTTIVLVGGMLLWLNSHISKKIDKTEERLDNKIDKLDNKIDKLENKVDNLSHEVNDIKMRMYGVETVLHMKDCCVLKSDQGLKKVE